MAKQEKDSEGDMTFYLPRVDGLNTVKHMCKRTLIFTFSIKTHCCISEHRSAVVLHLIMLPLCGQTKKHNEVWKKKIKPALMIVHYAGMQTPYRLKSM